MLVHHVQTVIYPPQVPVIVVRNHPIYMIHTRENVREGIWYKVFCNQAVHCIGLSELTANVQISHVVFRTINGYPLGNENTISVDCFALETRYSDSFCGQTHTYCYSVYGK